MAIYRGVGGASSTTSAANTEQVIQASTDAVAAAAAAAVSETNAAASAASAANSYDDFDDRYLGAKTSDPATDNDGDGLGEGALYFNTVSNEMKVYTGSAWAAFTDPVTTTESKTLTSGQTSVTFTNSTGFASFYVNGPDTDNGRLVAGVDYTNDSATNTITLTESYPADTVILLTLFGALGEVAVQSSQVVYDQGDASAVSRTVESKLGETVSVKDFGAVGDGVTDDTAAIQAAIDSMADNSSIVFPKGIYLVAPTIESSYILTLPNINNITILGLGATIKVEASSGNYLGILGYASGATPDGLTVRDVIFDHNGQNNDLGSLGAYSSRGRYTVSNYLSGNAFDNIVVSNVTVKNCDSVVSIYFTGSSSTAGSVSIDNCEWINARNYNGQDYDQSFINCRCDFLSITNNRFRGESWAYAPRTAIETHSSNQIVTGNIVEKFQIGINVTGISQTGTTYDHIVNNNAFEVSRDGILIWSQPLAPASATTGFENMLISKNIIRMRPDEFVGTASAGLRGIGIYGGSLHVEYKNLIIDGNQIVYPLDQSGSSYTTKSSSQAWGAISSRTSSTVNADAINVEITNNQIINCPMSGVFLEFSDWSGLKIEGNSFIDCGSTQNAAPASSTKQVIFFAGYLIGDCSISRNLFVDNFATTQVTDYIYLRDRTASPLYFFDVRDNEFRFTDSATIVSGADYLGVYSSSVLVKFNGEVPLDTNPRLPLITGGINSKVTVRSSDVSYTKNASGILDWKAEFFSSTSPSTGSWRAGDVAYNTSPTSGGTIGWVCTTTGSPGTWKTFGTIA